MGILDDIKAVQAESVIRRCKIGAFVESLPEKERGEFELALADSSYMHTTIASVMKARGMDAGAQAVSNHRRGACGCSRR